MYPGYYTMLRLGSRFLINWDRVTGKTSESEAEALKKTMNQAITDLEEKNTEDSNKAFEELFPGFKVVKKAIIFIVIVGIVVLLNNIGFFKIFRKR